MDGDLGRVVDGIEVWGVLLMDGFGGVGVWGWHWHGGMTYDLRFSDAGRRTNDGSCMMYFRLLKYLLSELMVYRTPSPTALSQKIVTIWRIRINNTYSQQSSSFRESQVEL